ncbi:MAG: hypothetical protein IT285_02155 [Bdellovibrionales bacterium]|nr:hypothetical protein [Bdellovibrionales bacterium]
MSHLFSASLLVSSIVLLAASPARAEEEWVIRQRQSCALLETSITQHHRDEFPAAQRRSTGIRTRNLLTHRHILDDAEAALQLDTALTQRLHQYLQNSAALSDLGSDSSMGEQALAEPVVRAVDALLESRIRRRPGYLSTHGTEVSQAAESGGGTFLVATASTGASSADSAEFVHDRVHVSANSYGVTLSACTRMRSDGGTTVVRACTHTRYSLDEQGALKRERGELEYSRNEVHGFNMSYDTEIERYVEGKVGYRCRELLHARPAPQTDTGPNLADEDSVDGAREESGTETNPEGSVDEGRAAAPPAS